ncbi:MAG: hypothetical protein U5J63_05460 [Fodinibius sp.]|nr:hypothetical protein [Fodinibius sp.]
MDRRQYPKNVGRKASFKFETTEGEKSEVEGVLQDVSENNITVQQEDDSNIYHTL